MISLWHWIVHVTGCDYTAPYGHFVWYDFHSGIGSNLQLIAAILIAPLILYRKHNCGQRWCWRIGRHELKDPVTGLSHMLCRRHHPDHPGKPVSAEHVMRIHRQVHPGGQGGPG